MAPVFRTNMTLTAVHLGQNSMGSDGINALTEVPPEPWEWPRDACPGSVVQSRPAQMGMVLILPKCSANFREIIKQSSKDLNNLLVQIHSP